MNYHERFERERFLVCLRAALATHYRHRFELLFSIASRPLKFPAPTRRRRSDRQLPKAA